MNAKVDFIKLLSVYFFFFLNIILKKSHKYKGNDNKTIINNQIEGAVLRNGIKDKVWEMANMESSNFEYVNSSKDYWEKRYSKGGNSGAGSYNNLALFKASIINDFVNKNNINTVIEWGSGDCNQLSLANYKNYIGYDVSQTAVRICQKKFNNDKTKTFIYMGDNFAKDKKADLSMSLDVLYHILEDNVFNSYMINLFNSSNKYVCIYSSNIEKPWAKHVRHRKFTDWIKKYIPNEWKLKQYIPNKYPFDIRKPDSTSLADFFFYEKVKI